MNLINLMPIVISAVLVVGFLIYLIWTPKPPKRRWKERR